jgi:hypothetical protein
MVFPIENIFCPHETSSISYFYSLGSSIIDAMHYWSNSKLNEMQQSLSSLLNGVKNQGISLSRENGRLYFRDFMRSDEIRGELNKLGPIFISF